MKINSFLAITAFLLYTSAGLFAQFPNSGFEDWTNKGTYLDPDGWYCTNSFSAGTFYPVVRITGHYPAAVGSYAVKIASRPSLLPDSSAYGICWYAGKITGHPTSLKGYWKYLPQNDSAMIGITLYNQGAHVTSGAIMTPFTISSWSAFSVFISGYANADSAVISLHSYFSGPQGNSELYIDNLSFDSLLTTGVHAEPALPDFTLYPNPAAEKLAVDFGSGANVCSMEIYNAVGERMVLQAFSNHQDETLVDVSGFAEGIYTMVLRTDYGGTLRKRIAVAR